MKMINAMVILCMAADLSKGDEATAHYNRGLELGKKDDLHGAIAEWREAVRLKPDYAEAHNNLGVALKGTGDFKEANTEYREALRLKPLYPEAHNNLATFRRKIQLWTI